MISLLLAWMMWMLGQGLPFPGPGTIHTVGGGGGSVTIRNNTFQSGGTNCGNGGSGCQVASAVVGTTGDAASVVYAFCGNNACTQTGCNATASDGTNTYSASGLSAVTSGSGSIGYVIPLVAKNATAGTYTVTLTVTGAGCTNFFGTVVFADFAGPSTSAPVDSAVSNSAQGTSATPSLASAGNVTNANEVAYCMMITDNTFTAGGSFSVLDSVASNFKSLDLVHPASGAGVTCNGTQTSGKYSAVVFAITP